MKEFTIELTNFCPHQCKFCSSNATNNINDAFFLDIETIKEALKDKHFQHIILSGGEPLAHPDFYKIFNLCKKHTDDVVVYSNLITHRVYNPHAIDGVYLEANLTVTPETDKIHILRRVKQGKEANRPEVSLSRNHKEDECQGCSHRVLRYDGKLVQTPCNKDEEHGEPKQKGEMVINIVKFDRQGGARVETNQGNYDLYRDFSNDAPLTIYLDIHPSGGAFCGEKWAEMIQALNNYAPKAAAILIPKLEELGEYRKERLGK